MQFLSMKTESGKQHNIHNHINENTSTRDNSAAIF